MQCLSRVDRRKRGPKMSKAGKTPWISASAGGLAKIATGRTGNLFAADLQKCETRLNELIGGRRVLVIGGAGSIGSAVVKMLIGYEPGAIDVVDQNENGLAELVRNLRSQPRGIGDVAVRFFPLDFGGHIMRRMLAEEPAYDTILNFAAIKHVRSEKDPYSLMQMLETNVLKTARLLGWLSDIGFSGRYHGVSTDKAANPVNLMGASKRFMEHMMFLSDVATGGRTAVTSARFANVAFSDGSLLHSFVNRLNRGQPLAAPRSIERFFISPPEAAAISMISAFAAPKNSITVPAVDEGSLKLTKIDAIAKDFLRHFGLEPAIYDDETAARDNVDVELRAGKYPLLLTAPDTSGEKPFEQFVSEGEVGQDMGLEILVAINYRPAADGTVISAFEELSNLVNGNHAVIKKQIVEILGRAIPLLAHAETGRNLDERM